MNDGLAIPQSAVLAYRIVRNRPEILLVTSRTRGRWVVPKGMITPGMTPAESAVKEAWEEAGVAGSVSRGCLGMYRYMKTRRCGVRSCAVKVYAMKVTAVLPKWPEQRMRRRRWMSIDEAICRVMDCDLKRLLITFRARLRSHGLALADAGPRIGSEHRGVPRGGFGLDGIRAGAAARLPNRRRPARTMR
jgi:8-oxo-dGTP pyrophosphatase MutT (NUDIX family)